MMSWSFYDSATGLFVDRRFSGPPGSIEANTPAGMSAIEGSHDHLSRRVDLATGEVVDWQPPQPSADHEWNAASRRWILTAAAAERETRRAQARARILQLEQAQHRPIRELCIDPNNADARTRLQAIDAEISDLRKVTS